MSARPGQLPTVEAGTLELGHPAHDAEITIRKRAAGGAVWIFVSFALSKVFGLASNVVLARLLTPEHFGLVAFAMVVIGAFTLLQDLGVPDALIYNQRTTTELLQTALAINLGAAVVLFCISALLAPLLARLGGDATIAPIVIVLAIGLIFSAAGSVQNALLSKQLAFRRRTLPDIVSLATESVVAIGLALAGFGVWSLVIGFLTLNLTKTLMLWYLSDAHPLPRYHASLAGQLVGYGKHVSLNAIVGFAANNVDYLIVGYVLGPRALGIYTLAFMVANIPTTAISQVLRTAMFPVYASLRQDRQRMVTLFEDVFVVVWTLSIGTGLVIFICAPLYMSLLLGDKWSTIGDPLRILTIFGVLRSIGAVFPPVYKALGRPDMDWKFTLARLLVSAPLMMLVAGAGVNAVSGIHAIVAAILVPLNAVFFARVAEVGLARIMRLIVGQLAGVAGVALLIALGRTTPSLRDAGSHPFELLLVVILASAVYLGAVVSLNRQLLARLLPALRATRPAGMR
ncbi:MAG TPA: lipopolysaccharide biosynthesis protein [Thermomicrobiales bacterium]|nr:lipopolysaccharide biosynthesis protein [Thermomicrobiales bacterium]